MLLYKLHITQMCCVNNIPLEIITFITNIFNTAIYKNVNYMTEHWVMYMIIRATNIIITIKYACILKLYNYYLKFTVNKLLNNVNTFPKFSKFSLKFLLIDTEWNKFYNLSNKRWGFQFIFGRILWINLVLNDERR